MRTCTGLGKPAPPLPPRRASRDAEGTVSWEGRGGGQRERGGGAGEVGFESRVEEKRVKEEESVGACEEEERGSAKAGSVDQGIRCVQLGGRGEEGNYRRVLRIPWGSCFIDDINQLA